jgi:glycosyltransferase-like protein
VSSPSPPSVAMLTYSVKPRGGVVHALAVAGALARRGHRVELFAVGRPGERFFRAPDVPASIVRHVPPDAPFDARIAALIEAYTNGLRGPLGAGAFDVVHAQDCVSANAALALRDEGVIPHVLRTVHHVDAFRSPSLVACQERSIVAPDAVVCVSEPWVARLREEFGVDAGLVANGVDPARYRPPRDASERAAARAAFAVGDRLTVLAIGGIEPRKGSLTLLDAFAGLRRALPARDPLLVVAGGATLFDYRDEIERFAARRRALGLGDAAVRVLGPVADEELELLYRSADVLAFPSVKEGFGLVVLEALASGLPVVASDLDVLRGFLVDGESALLRSCGDAAGFADALERVATDAALAARLRAGGRAVVARHGWDAAALAHERAYSGFLAGRAGVVR